MYRERGKQFLAIFLIVNFIFCNTPTSVLHALFANHIDTKVTCQEDPSVIHFDVAGLDCHCYTNVVTTPYLQPSLPLIAKPVFEYFLYHEVVTPSPADVTCRFSSLRAPPFLS